VAPRALESIDPFSGARIAAWPELTEVNLERALESAQRAASAWASASFDERALVLRRVAELLRERVEPLALLMAEEMASRSPGPRRGREVRGRLRVLRRARARAAGRRARATGQQRRARVRDLPPLGLVLAIMPGTSRCGSRARAAPTLMAGNGLLLKHAENVQGCARALATLFEDAGAQRGLFTNLALGVERIPR